MMTETITKSQMTTGRIFSGMVILFMLFDAIIKFLKPTEVIQTTVNQLGYSERHILIHGISSLIGTVLYAFPRTSIFGAILLTGHLGGAIASNLRVDNLIFSHTLFPVYVGIFMWLGLWLRNIRLRAIFPLTNYK